MSRPSEPVETVSTSIDLSFLPSRMIEPLPKLRSIWESAASRAFDLSMEEPSTRRNPLVVIAPTPYRTGLEGPTTKVQRESNVHDLFSVRNMFFFALRVPAGASTRLGAGLCDESEERFQEVLRTAGKQKPKEPASEKIKTEALGGGVNPAEGFLTQELWGALDESPEPIVHAGAPDVALQVHVAVGNGPDRAPCPHPHAVERFPIAEVNVEVLALDRPAVTERVFEAAAHRPAATRIGLLDTRGDLIADDPERAVDLRPRSAAGHVDHRLVPDGPAELAAGRHQPTLLQLPEVKWVLDDAGTDGNISPGRRFLAALFVGRGAVGFAPPTPRADLIVAAELPPADEA